MDAKAKALFRQRAAQRAAVNKSSGAARPAKTQKISETASAPGGAGVEVGWWDSLGYPHVRPIGTDAPCASQNENLAFFGMGFEPGADVKVRFPSGLTLEYPGVPPRTRFTAVEPVLFDLSYVEEAAGGADLVVTAYAHDRHGVRLGPGAAVRIEADGLVATGPVTHVAGNVFQRGFAAAAVPGEYPLRLTYGDWQVGVRPRVRYRGPVDAAASGLELKPECVRAGTADTVAVSFAPKDANGLALGPGLAVTLNVPGVAGPVALADLGDGRYRASFAAPPAPGIYPLEIGCAGADLGALGTLEAAGSPSAVQTSVYEDSPTVGFAQQPYRLKLEVVPRDAAGRRLGPGTVVRVVPAPDALGTHVQVPPEPRPNGMADGTFVFVLERSPLMPQGSATGIYQVYADGVLVASAPYSF